ncbi:MAG: DUF1893 domain-containing protein [Candidatus Woesearchaeota archaeon]
MINPDFEKNSLVLIKDDNVIFSSEKSGLRPLFECVIKFKGKESDCVLYDRIVGLAASRLIVYSGIISKVITPVCSKPAHKLLKDKWIEIESKKIVENILRMDKSDICPMEKLALETKDNKEFWKKLHERMTITDKLMFI